MDQTFSFAKTFRKKVARRASEPERAIPRGEGSEGRMEGRGGKMRAGGGRKRKRSAAEEGSLPCLLCSLAQKSSLVRPSVRPPLRPSSFSHLHCYDGKFMGSMAGIFWRASSSSSSGQPAARRAGACGTRRRFRIRHLSMKIGETRAGPKRIYCPLPPPPRRAVLLPLSQLAI